MYKRHINKQRRFNSFNAGKTEVPKLIIEATIFEHPDILVTSSC